MINSAINSADKFKDPKEILNTSSGETIFPLFLLFIFSYCTERGKESFRFPNNFFSLHITYFQALISTFSWSKWWNCVFHMHLSHANPLDPDPGSSRLFLSLYLHLSLLPPVITSCSKATVLARSREGML